MGELADFLAERDASCYGCGYSLRGLTTGVCPECGQAIDLDALRAWLEERGELEAEEVPGGGESPRIVAGTVVAVGVLVAIDLVIVMLIVFGGL